MDQVIEGLLDLRGGVAYLVIGLLAFGEAAAFVGLFLPGEVAVLLGGGRASQGRVSLAGILAVTCVACAGTRSSCGVPSALAPLAQRDRPRRRAGQRHPGPPQVKGAVEDRRPLQTCEQQPRGAGGDVPGLRGAAPG